MTPFKRIRTRLRMTQAELAGALQITQSNVGHYEARGQLVSVPVAARLIKVARRHGVKVTFDDLYRHYLRKPAARAASAKNAAQVGQ